MLADDRNRIIELQHVDNACHLARGPVFEARELAAHDRAKRYGGELHAWDHDINAVDRFSLDLLAEFEPPLRRIVRSATSPADP